MPPGSFSKALNIAARGSVLLVPSLFIASKGEKGELFTPFTSVSPSHQWYLNAFSIAHCDGKELPVVHKEGKHTLQALLSAAPIGTRPELTVSLSSAAHRTANNQQTIAATATYPANDPSEDRALCGSEGEFAFAAVFDGHGGWQVSDTASRVLLPLLLRSVSGKNHTQIEEAIVEAFLEAERLIVESIRPAFQMGFGNVAKVGSCVIVALRKKDTLYLANCGDCRAVMGSVLTTSEGEGILGVKLNSEHNCREEVERKLLELQHPGESDVVRCKNSHACYVKGRLQLTRSLGDAYLKYHEFNGSPDKSRGRYIPEPYTPPYVSHVPDVYSFPLQPQNKFVVLGSDGVWDYLSSQEAAEIVHEGMKNKEKEEVVAAKIVERALEIAAAECGANLNRLKSYRPGRERRSRHDDTTAVVMYL